MSEDMINQNEEIAEELSEETKNTSSAETEASSVETSVEETDESGERKPVMKIFNDSDELDVLATPEDFTSPDEIYQVLLEKIKLYHPSDDFSMIEKAYHIADEAHEGQKRKSGEPYIIHPLLCGDYPG